MITIGSTIPDFEVDAFQNEEIKKIKLSDYQGKWLVLLFYPADFTFVCPTELRDAAKYYEEFKQLNTEVVSVSVDTAFVHKAWHDASEAIKTVQFPMLADPTREVCKAFGTYIEQDGLSVRATFIVDPNGVIKSMDLHDNSIGRNTKEILRRLKASQYVAANPGEVCPVSWEPGESTLKPGVELVGKI